MPKTLATTAETESWLIQKPAVKETILIITVLIRHQHQVPQNQDALLLLVFQMVINITSTFRVFTALQLKEATETTVIIQAMLVAVQR